MRRVILFVLDSLEIGGAADFGDDGATVTDWLQIKAGIGEVI